MTELRDQLQSSLSGAYTLDRELTGGGMSRVFVADETRLGRKVVVKVLSPELAAALSTERFEREIRLAASLQQANIVPVLAAGESSGLPYYTMPFVEGESLRARLARAGGPLSIGETLGILKDVAKALAYAHDHGIVHRDIKPDNVLLSGGTAVVTDFGIAKAIVAARTGEHRNATLTQVGTSIGTPAYMAPEQAAGDDVDHRADIYALGCVAYELLTGQAPFAGRTPQRMLAAHMSELPRPVGEIRLDVSEKLASLVMRCLEKDPKLRPQKASEVVQDIEAVTTSGASSTEVAVLLQPRVPLWKALGIYAMTLIAVPVLAKAAVIAIGLPTWVVPASIVAMLVGLPVILSTYFVQRVARKAVTMTPTLTPGGSPVTSTMANLAVKASPHLTWRRAAWGGVATVAILTLFVAGFMTLRALGVGPAGSLMAAGVLSENERLVLADFKSPANDSALGPVVTDALRAELGQSKSVQLLQPLAAREALRRMQRPVNSPVDFALAREIATREGIKAVVDGEVLGFGGSYVIAARLVATQTGQELATFRQEADDARGIIPAIGRLSRDIRSKIGESLRAVNSAPPLEQVTTSSLEALKKYVQGSRAIGAGQSDRGVALLGESIALDTTFAMAYRRLAAELNNRGGQRARVNELIAKAYEHRDRLTDSERYLTIAGYFQWGPSPDQAKALEAYESLIELQPDNATAWNNAGNIYRERRDFAKAEAAYAKAIESGGPRDVYFNNLFFTQAQTGNLAAIRQTAVRWQKSLPTSAAAAAVPADIALLEGKYDSAAIAYERLARNGGHDAISRENAFAFRARAVRARGQMAAASRAYREWSDMRGKRGVADAPVLHALLLAHDAVWFRADTARAMRILDSAAVHARVEALPGADRPYGLLGRVYALAGRTAQARTVLAADERARPSPVTGELRARNTLAGDIAIAERQYDRAVQAYRAADIGLCVPCALPDIARAYDLGGNADSAIVIMERYLADPGLERRSAADWTYLAGVEKRLGELYEAKGDRQKALSHYLAFVELWKDADPELQPRVVEVRTRIARLRDTEGR